MDRLREMEVFAAVADAGSFAQAGVRLGIFPPAVTCSRSGSVPGCSTGRREASA